MLFQLSFSIYLFKSILFREKIQLPDLNYYTIINNIFTYVFRGYFVEKPEQGEFVKYIII